MSKRATATERAGEPERGLAVKLRVRLRESRGIGDAAAQRAGCRRAGTAVSPGGDEGVWARRTTQRQADTRGSVLTT